MNLLQWGIACGMTGCLLAAASAAELIWKNDEYRIYPKKNRCIVRKMSGVPSGLEVLFRPTQSRPGVEAPFMVVAIVQKDSRFSDRMASYGAFAVDVENCNDRPLVFQVRIVTHHGKVERATENFRQIIPARSKVTVTAPYATVAPFSRIALDPRLRLSPAGVDCNVNLFRERLSVDFGVLSASLYQEKEYKFKLTNFRLTGQPPQYTPLLAHPEKFFPFIDDFGQYIHADWPEKVHSEADLKARAVEERKALAATTPIPRRTRFGGWADGPTLRATGFFRVERYEGKWYFVDPEGRLFFSRGVNSVRLSSSWSLPKTAGREALYSGGPAKPGAPIDFFLRNIERKYGSVDAWKAAQPERLAGWGFNTLGNWSDSLLCRNGKMPYLIDIPLPASTRLPGNPSLWDVYDPEFARRLEHYLANTIGWTRNDPFCIGYFIGNEVKFGPEDEAARRIFTAPAERPAKRELVRFLKGKFSSIDKLNRAWGSRYASWEELAASTRPPERKLAQKEFAAFSRGYIERFYRISRDTVRKCAPNHLYLGSRTPVADIYRAHVNEPHAAYADVVSVNNYALQLDNLKMRGIPDDKPLLISESSVGHQSRGVFSSLSYPGLEPGAREDALNCLLKSAARHPQIVGIHHFQFADQPLIGRYDGENYGIGLVDVTDTPYREFVGANRNFSEQLYRFRRGTPPVKFRRGF